MLEPLPPHSARRPQRSRRTPARWGKLPRVALGVAISLALVTLSSPLNAPPQPAPIDPVSELPPALRLDLPPLPPSQLAPQPSAPAERWARINAQDVNLRAQPRLDGAVISRSRTQERYRLTGKEDSQNGKRWRELLLPDGRSAWVSAEFVAEDVLSESPAEAAGVSAQAELLELNQAPGSTWVKATPEARLEVLKPMLARIFAADPSQVTSEHIVKLDACMRASGAEPDLASLKVYELGAACALALGWAPHKPTP
ncbi:MAG: hypothetical protein ACO1RX_18070 [Candidatus Sericytochromatia bacterium]